MFDIRPLIMAKQIRERTTFSPPYKQPVCRISPKSMKEVFINKLVCQPWGISRFRGRTLIASTVQQIRSERPEKDAWGTALPRMEIVGDVALIPIRGVLTLNLPAWVKQLGLSLTDVNDVAEELAEAGSNPSIAMIVLNFDSPGGWSLAGQKLYDVVASAQARKPVFAWCDDGFDLGSAAYHGALPARMILTGRYALAVGCVGSYQTIVDDTEFWKMGGIKIDVIRSGDMKGMGIDGFSEEQLAWLQSEANRYGARFRADVTQRMPLLDQGEMEGQFYDGEAAAGHCFTDGVAGNLEAAMRRFRMAI